MQSNHARSHSAAPKDRRAAQRYRFYVDVEIDWGAIVQWGRVHDVSRTGMFIEIAQCSWVNASFTARLALNVPLSVECIVRRIVPGQGIGVTIAFRERQAKKRYNALLRALEHEPELASTGEGIPQVPAPLPEPEAHGKG